MLAAVHLNSWRFGAISSPDGEITVDRLCDSALTVIHLCAESSLRSFSLRSVVINAHRILWIKRLNIKFTHQTLLVLYLLRLARTNSDISVPVDENGSWQVARVTWRRPHRIGGRKRDTSLIQCFLESASQERHRSVQLVCCAGQTHHATETSVAIIRMSCIRCGLEVFTRALLLLVKQVLVYWCVSQSVCLFVCPRKNSKTNDQKLM